MNLKNLIKNNWEPIGSAVAMAALWMLFMMGCVMMLTSCGTKRTVETNDYRHERTETLRQIDSLMKARLTEIQDSQSHKLIIRDSIKLREITVTNTIQTVDQQGNIIATATTTTTDRDRDHVATTEKEDIWISRMQTIDSLISINQVQSDRIDSLLKSQNKEVVKDAVQLPWYKQLLRHLRYMILGSLIGIVAAIWWNRVSDKEEDKS